MAKRKRSKIKMKNKEEIEEQRRIIRKVLEKIIDESNEIDNALSNEKHPRGRLYRSLGSSKDGKYIVHSTNGFSAGYRTEDDQLYTISIHKIGVPKK